ncbi:MAG: hypothetical protein K9M96_07410 [Deltaproteobacteria bacterium]|nr:hypothetical protein [Deltaproteobacteria bacterium]MCF8119801.1 hypothetical protein [Deltaproteobacteria bacterium]
MKWYTLINVEKPSSDRVVMTAEVDPGSPWFSGHFPNDPILPGIAQLEMALDGVSRLCERRMRISGVKKVRFKHMIRPKALITISVSPRKKAGLSYGFHITVDGEQASNGILVVEEVQGRIEQGNA